MDGGVEKEAFRGWDSTVRGTLQLGWELRSLYDMLQHVWLLCAGQEGRGKAGQHCVEVGACGLEPLLNDCACADDGAVQHLN